MFLASIACARAADPSAGTEDTGRRSANFDKLDTNGDGSLSKEEFMNRKQFANDAELAGKAEKAFVKFDTDGDGALNREEFVHGGKAPANDPRRPTSAATGAPEEGHHWNLLTKPGPRRFLPGL